MPRLIPSYSRFLCLMLIPIAAALALAPPSRPSRPVLQIGRVASRALAATGTARTSSRACARARTSSAAHRAVVAEERLVLTARARAGATVEVATRLALALPPAPRRPG